MDLREFVSQTLTQVIRGVTDAKRVNLGGAAINPKQGQSGGAQGAPDVIEFDLAVTVEKDGSSKEESGMKIHVLSAGGDKSGKKPAEAGGEVTRVKFRIPVQYP